MNAVDMAVEDKKPENTKCVHCISWCVTGRAGRCDGIYRATVEMCPPVEIYAN